MNRILAIGLVAAAGFSLSAQTVALSGKVTDQSQKPVAGAVVALKSRQLADTTGATGAFTLTGGTSAAYTAPSLPGAESVTFNNGVINMRLAHKVPVSIELFDVRGNMLRRTSVNNVSAGEYRYDLKKHACAVEMLVGRVSAGEYTLNFRYLPLAGVGRSISSPLFSTSGASLAKVQAMVDSLQVTALGYKTKVVKIASYEETVTVALEAEVAAQCTPSKSVSLSNGIRGSGPHKVVMETNSDPGIKEGTIYRPEDLAPGKNYPILIWGQGACSRDGRGAEASNAEIASYGYVVIADGTPSGGGGALAMNLNAITPVARAYAKWIIAENRKPCSAYYQSVDTTKVASNGFSCGGLFGMALAGEPYIATWGVSSSGCLNGNGCPETWNVTHTPVIIIEGNSGDPGYANGLRDYNGIAALKKWPVYFISNKKMGHGGDLWNANGGDFTKIHLAWLNWWIKGDTSETTGKGVLVGSTCKYCTNSDWEIKSADIP